MLQTQPSHSHASLLTSSSSSSYFFHFRQIGFCSFAHHIFMISDIPARFIHRWVDARSCRSHVSAHAERVVPLNSLSFCLLAWNMLAIFTVRFSNNCELCRRARARTIQKSSYEIIVWCFWQNNEITKSNEEKPNLNVVGELG